jgi:TRAP-type uncharacterized transport system substrate-binding protein
MTIQGKKIMNWLQKISQTNIQILLDKYNKKVEEYILDLAYKSNDRVEKLKNFQIDTDFVINTFQQSNYPEIEQLKLALQNKDIDNLEQQLYHIAQWKSKENIPYDQGRFPRRRSSDWMSFSPCGDEATQRSA